MRCGERDAVSPLRSSSQLFRGPRAPKDDERLFSVKMRAARGGQHISGAERIVPERAIPQLAAAMAERAIEHAKGRPDFINIKVELAPEPVFLKALHVSTHGANTPEEGWAIARSLLAADGITRIDEILGLFHETYGMRGAMLLDADTLERLEPDVSRGVRATFMDDAASGKMGFPSEKNHYAEAIVLATKVANAPGIVGEICMSDDPGYVTGYVASRRIGYARITCLKKKGDPAGGRIFLYRGPREKVGDTIDFIQRRCVLVKDVPIDVPGTKIPRAEAELSRELEGIRAAGLWRTVRERPSGLKVFADNDYLGLSNDPRLKAAAADAIERFGAGSGASRLVTGTLQPHVALERHLARFKGTEDALVLATGYMANVGTISALVGKGDAVFSDALNHASIVDGCRLSGADVFIYRHNDMDDLAAKVAQAGPRRRRLAVSDAVFSMDGDILNLPCFLDVCRANGVLSMIDEAHSTGVMGAAGRGLCEHFRVEHPDVLMGTLSKALGCEGGYVCATRTVCDYLRNRSRAFMFSTAHNPGSAAAADMALTILEEHPELACEVRMKAQAFAMELFSYGIPARTDSAIVPIIIGDERCAVEVSKRLEDMGFLVPAIRYPAVAKGAARLRVSVSAASSSADLHALALLIAECLHDAGACR